MTDMYEHICAICQKKLSSKPCVVLGQKGSDTVNRASVARGSMLMTKKGQRLHVNCRMRYTQLAKKPQISPVVTSKPHHLVQTDAMTDEQWRFKLIGEVKRFPCLYSRRNNSRQTRQRAWTAVSQVMGSKAEFCKAIWLRLRDKLTREAKMSRDSLGTYHSNWVFYQAMCFVTPHIIPQRTTDAWPLLHRPITLSSRGHTHKRRAGRPLMSYCPEPTVRAKHQRQQRITITKKRKAPTKKMEPTVVAKLQRPQRNTSTKNQTSKPSSTRPSSSPHKTNVEEIDTGVVAQESTATPVKAPQPPRGVLNEPRNPVGPGQDVPTASRTPFVTGQDVPTASRTPFVTGQDVPTASRTPFVTGQDVPTAPRTPFVAGQDLSTYPWTPFVAGQVVPTATRTSFVTGQDVPTAPRTPFVAGQDVPTTPRTPFVAGQDNPTAPRTPFNARQDLLNQTSSAQIEHDEEFYFGMNVACKLRQMTPINRAVAQTAIRTRLMQIEFGGPDLLSEMW